MDKVRPTPLDKVYLLTKLKGKHHLPIKIFYGFFYDGSELLSFILTPCQPYCTVPVHVRTLLS